MTRFDGGFFALERRILTDYAGDLAGFGIWVWLIGRAEHRSKLARVFGEKERRTIERGQLITGVDEIARQWRVDEKIVRVRLAQLEASGCITQEIQSGNKGGRIITVCNYEIYQDLRRRAPMVDINAGLPGDATNGKGESINSIGAAHAGNEETTQARRGHDTGTTRAGHAGLDAGLPGDATNGKGESINSIGAAHADSKKHDAGTTRAGHRHDAGTTRPLNNHITSDQQPANQGSLFPEGASAPRAPKATKSEKARATKESKSGRTWDAYSTAIRLFHNFDPKPNAMVRSQACKLVDMLGADVAPEVAEYYVLNEKRHWVVQARHPFGELLKNAQKYFGDWTTGQKVSTAAARTIERDDANRDAIREYRARKETNANLGG